MSIGYIKIYRQFLETSFYRDSAAVHLALTLLVNANYKDAKTYFNDKEITVERGQLITGRNRLATLTGLKSSTVRNKLDKLRKVGFLTIKSNNKYSLITICKYNDYQGSQEEVGQQTGQPLDINLTSTGQQLDTSKEGKKERREEVKKKDLKDIVVFDFKNTWKRYPNRDGKKDAERHFKSTIKTEKDFQDINKALDNYLQHLKKETWKKPKNGSTWFNNWRDWIDWHEPTKQQKPDDLCPDCNKPHGGNYFGYSKICALCHSKRS